MKPSRRRAPPRCRRRGRRRRSPAASRPARAGSAGGVGVFELACVEPATHARRRGGAAARCARRSAEAADADPAPGARDLRKRGASALRRLRRARFGAHAAAPGFSYPSERRAQRRPARQRSLDGGPLAVEDRVGGGASAAAVVKHAVVAAIPSNCAGSAASARRERSLRSWVRNSTRWQPSCVKAWRASRASPRHWRPSAMPPASAGPADLEPACSGRSVMKLVDPIGRPLSHRSSRAVSGRRRHGRAGRRRTSAGRPPGCSCRRSTSPNLRRPDASSSAS